ncbi:MAG: DUF4870 domain-containing protein [Armatimonadota bacterium]
MSMQPAPADQSNRLLGALAYPIWIIALVIILTDKKKDSFLRHHGWTALFWGIAWFIIYVALSILGNIPFLGWILVILGGPILWLVWLALSIYYAVQAYNGKEVTIPVVSDWARKYVAQSS